MRNWRLTGLINRIGGLASLSISRVKDDTVQNNKKPVDQQPEALGMF